MSETLEHVQNRAAIELARMQSQLTDKQRRLSGLKMRLESALGEIQSIQTRKLTPYVALFDRDGDRFKCLGVFNPEADENLPSEWLFCIPIPDLESMGEFGGF